MRRTAAWAVLLAASVVAAATIFAWPITDYDFWEHIAIGREIVAAHAFPRIETLSHTMAGTPWIDFEWLFQVAAYLLVRVGGFPAVIWAKAVVASLALCFSALAVRAEGGDTGLSLAGFWSAFRLAAPRALERPELATLLFLPLFLWILLCVRAGASRRRLYVLPPLMVIWANTHGGFVIGLGLLCLSLAGAWAETRAEGRSDPFVRDLAVACAACVAASGVTPYGFRIYEAVFFHLAKARDAQALVSEWAPVTFANAPLFWALITACFGVLARDVLRGRARSYFWIPILLVFGAWGAHLLRNPPYVALVCVPYLFSRLGQERGNLWRLARTAALVLGAAIAAVYSWGAARRDFRVTVDWSRFPRGAAEFVRRENLPGRMYNTYEFGGYLEWVFGKSRPVFCDGRFFVFYPVIMEQAGTGGSYGAWRNFLSRHGVDYAVIRNVGQRAPWTSFFPPSSWALVYRDDTALVFRRLG